MMQRRLVLTLHLDAFNMAQGGGYTVYDPAGKKLASMAFPAFPGGEMTAEAAAVVLTETWIRVEGQQLPFPEFDQAPTVD